MSDDHQVGKIRTRSGLLVSPLDLRGRDVRISDIASALSMLCRFNGHTRRFYSVAEHCVRVSKLVEWKTNDKELALHGLLHDASEAYLVDIPRPLKRHPKFSEYRKLETLVQSVCLAALGLDPVEPDIVVWADRESCKQEGSVLMKGWDDPPTLDLFPPIRCFAPAQARLKFLDRYSDLTQERIETA